MDKNIPIIAIPEDDSSAAAATSAYAVTLTPPHYSIANTNSNCPHYFLEGVLYDLRRSSHTDILCDR